MGHFDFDADEIISIIGNMARRVPEALPEACERAEEIVQRQLIGASPHRMNVLKQSIRKTKPRKTDDGVRGVIFVSPRGKKDRNIYKAVVSEFGSDSPKPNKHRQKGTNWWSNAVRASETEALEAARDIIVEAVDKL